jgi:hypothetical protein
MECALLSNQQRSDKKREWYAKNAGSVKSRVMRHYQKNRERKLAYASEYQKKNIRRIIIQRSARADSDPVYALKQRVRHLIKNSLYSMGARKNTKTAAILGCSSEQFRRHIERQFTGGMGWHNSSEWHLDHIIPISSAKNEDDVIALNHFTNLRPLWASDNLKKHAKMEFLI